MSSMLVPRVVLATVLLAGALILTGCFTPAPTAAPTFTPPPKPTDTPTATPTITPTLTHYAPSGNPFATSTPTPTPIAVDNTPPASGLSPTAGSYMNSVQVSWNAYDYPGFNGAPPSGVASFTCQVTITDQNGVTIIQRNAMCSGSQVLGTGVYQVSMTARDNAGNHLSDSRLYTVTGASSATPTPTTPPTPTPTGTEGPVGGTTPTPGPTPTPTPVPMGYIHVQAAYTPLFSTTASPWTGAMSYTLHGPVTRSGTGVSQTFYLPIGTYTLTYSSGGPSSHYTVAPSQTQTISSNGGGITFTFNFTAN